MNRFFFVLGTLGLFGAAPAFSAPYIAVGKAHTRKTIVAFPEIRASDKRVEGLAQVIQETVTNDLSFMDLFQFLKPAAFIEDPMNSGLTLDSFKLSNWTAIGAEFLVKAAIGMNGDNVMLEAHLYDTFGGKQVLAKRYLATEGDVKTLAHTFANNIVEALTGLQGIFLTKLAMVCERNNRKEIYMMNFDGTEAKQVTHHHSISFSPAWSPDGTKIAYSVFAKHRNNVKNIDLYEYDFTTNTIRMLSNRKGINSGAAFSPDGKKIALTMSFLGNPEIFLLDPTSGTVSRITKSFGFDVDPSWSPDGRQIAFVSSRSGMPMVFKMNADGSNPQRLTYAGRYNASPSWSAEGANTNAKISFAGWIDKKFDIFIMNPDGTHIERLTKDQGNNEDPFFSPDGSFIAFSSNRTGQPNIYVMNVDGTFVKRMTYGMGNCTAPKWSNPPPKP
jgi:TolB protein